MKRNIEYIDAFKWYHLESLKKFFKGWDIRTESITDANGKLFDTVLFCKNWQRYRFFVHPKHKRLKKTDSPGVFEEINFNRN